MTGEQITSDDDRRNNEWSDYRKHYGVSAEAMTEAHKAFIAGWKARAGETYESEQS